MYVFTLLRQYNRWKYITTEAFEIQINSADLLSGAKASDNDDESAILFITILFTTHHYVHVLPNRKGSDEKVILVHEAAKIMHVITNGTPIYEDVSFHDHASCKQRQIT